MKWYSYLDDSTDLGAEVLASAVENNSLSLSLKDSVSPVLIEDISDKNSYFVIMPMKI